jgi:hypothetical protein
MAAYLFVQGQINCKSMVRISQKKVQLVSGASQKALEEIAEFANDLCRLLFRSREAG